MPPRLLIGSDTGGTFTDFVRLDETGLRTWKVASTPDDFARGVLDGVERLLGEPASRPAAVELVHSTTVATNALLERKGARVALLTTRGFRDVLAIGRQARPDLYDLHVVAPTPLVPERRRLEVDERVSAEGEVLRALGPADLERTLDRAEAEGAESIAACLLFSFLDPGHERALGEAARRRGFPVSLSSEVSGELREYERTCTTVVDAYVGPGLDRYLRRLAEGVRRAGIDRLRIVHSNGGSVGWSATAGRAVHSVLSGPAAGVAGALAAAREVLGDRPRIVSFDMGGTSTDVSLVDGEPGRQREAVVGGVPLQVPMIDVHTIGAGGGSIAWIDPGGALRVGPESAGADPGPACYGWGDLPTVTDAHVVLGRLPSDRFLGGRMTLQPDRSWAALEALGGRMGVGARTAAEAVVEVVEAGMERALRVVSVRRGHDPGDFTLVSFGGAGGLHACRLAEALGTRSVLVPREPGVLSALGAAASEVRREVARSVVRDVDAGIGGLEGAFDELCARAVREMAEDGISGADLVIARSADLRYRGQTHALEVEYDPDPGRLSARFHAAHRRRFGHAEPGWPVEIVTLRLATVGRTAVPGPGPIQGGARDVAEATVENREGFAVVDRERVGAGATWTGPAVVVEPYATTLVPPGWTARVLEPGHLWIERGRG
jgi:N-methylhydantoinase A